MSRSSVEPCAAEHHRELFHDAALVFPVRRAQQFRAALADLFADGQPRVRKQDFECQHDR